ncbi:unnamed protein product [Allacma fusca]|uniref:Uncharacterized protein n=1 Tax=Allacma fusca TaxID=39272 RepID=A0A8J2JNZ8_9HEXA|nr:unnamed protein product [Allacma fusca]
MAENSVEGARNIDGTPEPQVITGEHQMKGFTTMTLEDDPEEEARKRQNQNGCCCSGADTTPSTSYWCCYMGPSYHGDGCCDCGDCCCECGDCDGCCDGDCDGCGDCGEC